MLSKEEAISTLQRLGKQMVSDGLAWGNAGNISLRTGAQQFLITTSGSSLGELGADDLVECTVRGEVISEHSQRPSKEAPMHAAIYKDRQDINAVVHAHPFYGLIVACSEEAVPQNLYVENMYYQERMARVEYHHPGSPQLAEAVGQKARLANLLILENHGVLAYDTSSKDAYLTLQTFEITCKMHVLCRAANIPITGLPREVVQQFLADSGYKPRREWPGV